jgi:glycosyltransferase involved in cell wall biosynthesis
MNWPRRIAQFAPQIVQHDAIGNEVFALHNLFRKLGIASEVFCQVADLASRPHVRTSEKLKRFRGDVALVHFSHGADGFECVYETGAPIVLIYHGCTPAHYFRGANRLLAEASRQGYRQLRELSRRAAVCVAHSHFTARELEEVGAHDPVVFPYVLNEGLYSLVGDVTIQRTYGADGWVNLLTVGRIVPNKRCEDCILVFDYFRRFVQPRSRLFLVGSYEGTERYRERLEWLTDELGLSDVYFTGVVSQEALVSYYRVARAYLAMSEHEGFGAPLVEAMRFGVPVFALESCAVVETLRGAGVVFAERSWPVIAEAIGMVLEDRGLCEQLLAAQRRAVAYYAPEMAEERLRNLLQRIATRLGKTC